MASSNATGLAFLWHLLSIRLTAELTLYFCIQFGIHICYIWYILFSELLGFAASPCSQKAHCHEPEPLADFGKKREEWDIVLILTSQWQCRVPGIIRKVNYEMLKAERRELATMPEGIWESSLLTESLRTQLCQAERERLPGTGDRKKNGPQT